MDLVALSRLLIFLLNSTMQGTKRTIVLADGSCCIEQAAHLSVEFNNAENKRTIVLADGSCCIEQAAC